MSDAKNKSICRHSQREVHVVLGGGGYPGYHLGLELHRLGHNVTLFDVCQPCGKVPETVTFVQGDLRRIEDVEKAVQGADCVYHMASYGMSGREQLKKKLIAEVNIDGTHSVIKLCQKLGISRLVYTSTYNVVFGGQEIVYGDESLPYFPVDKHPDNYSRTKAIAEQAVLKADGCKLQVDTGDGQLHTCALRLAGVYGPGELRHLPRIVEYVERGLFRFTYGESDSLVEFLHVDNLVQAHVLAGQALTPSKHYVASGQAYFISDGKPVNNFEFFRPLVVGLGYPYPVLKVPISFIYFLAFLTEMVHSVVGRFYNFQPILTRAEVFKTGVTHYFNISKARQELGYIPAKQNDLIEATRWFLEHGHGRIRSSTASSSILRVLRYIVIGLAFVAVLLSFLPACG